eukprot:gene12479-14438_t
MKNRQLGAYAEGAVVAIPGDLIVERPRGAYATSKPKIPDVVGSDASSSVILSSLHSSEQSAADAHALYPGDDVIHHTGSPKSAENIMEEGGNPQEVGNHGTYVPSADALARRSKNELGESISHISDKSIVFNNDSYSGFTISSESSSQYSMHSKTQIIDY